MMKALTLIFSIIGAFLLAGCDKYSGPIVQNNATTSVEITVHYSDGTHSDANLSPGNALWQRRQRVLPERIIITREGKQLSFEQTFLRELLTRVPKIESAAIIFDGVTLDIMTIAEAKKKGLR